MAEIIDFPLEQTYSAQQRALIESAEREGARFLKAAESLLGVLKQAERTQAAILAYQAEMRRSRSEITPHVDSRNASESLASRDVYPGSNIRYASDD
ncbi:hypothetical protein [Rhizobium rhizogenes]|uniref:hypothetical protein n=1 Tax=Rhizobium rhizogenes TaxID=359 RepID=UPI001571A17F|nr:hypothetical protein [Rhizobium rhizogenes]NTH68626.1 hypothetical protein [Rhizobium rhizogenes]NTI39597.1 hypothetical protein [Rhizobium rhizogenes]WEO69826.1 hypothetical protein G6L54_033255 [Rhizobium rhizogenes]